MSLWVEGEIQEVPRHLALYQCSLKSIGERIEL